MSEHHDYDVIIIGAGISGLICGCYLAKAGLKTLIVEKNAKPGGYCVSFKRKEFNFDACVHGLSSLRKGAKLDKLINELELSQYLKMNRHNPSDIILTSNHRINIFNELDMTLKEFQSNFPNQRNQIKRFMEYVLNTPINYLTKIRGVTFEEMLNSYFSDKELKSVLSIVMTGLVGVFPRYLSSLVACLIYREFVFDGGYYPLGGIQSFPDALLKKFIDFHGKALFSKRVVEIKIEDNKVKGIILNNGEYICAKYIISACDLKQTFFELIGKDKINDYIQHKLNSIVPSLSAFLLYVGISNNIDLNKLKPLNANIWYITNLDIQSVVFNTFECKPDFVAITSPYIKNKNGGFKDDKISVCLSALTPYKSHIYWSDNIKKIFSNRLLQMADRLIPDLSKNVIFELSSSPYSLYKWTHNYQGAAYGLASTISQFGNPDFSQKTDINNLYLTGHWTNLSSGVTSVINCGYDTAELILLKEKRKL